MHIVCVHLICISVHIPSNAAMNLLVRIFTREVMQRDELCIHSSFCGIKKTVDNVVLLDVIAHKQFAYIKALGQHF